MAFNGTEGNPISAETTKRWRKQYLEKMQELGVKDPIWGEFFGCEILNEILAQSNKNGHCKGIRIYYGIDDEGVQRLMLLGATENEKNMWPESNGKDGSDCIIGEDGMLCPPHCPDDD